jgi:hypothetical protein
MKRSWERETDIVRNAVVETLKGMTDVDVSYEIN